MKFWRIIFIFLVGFFRLNSINGQTFNDHENNNETSKLENSDHEEILTSDENKNMPSLIEIEEPSIDTRKNIEEEKLKKNNEHAASERILNPENNGRLSSEMSQTNDESHKDIPKSENTGAGLPVETFKDESTPIPDEDAEKISKLTDAVKEKEAPVGEGSTSKNHETISPLESVEESHVISESLELAPTSPIQAPHFTNENSEKSEHRNLGATDDEEKLSTSKIFKQAPTLKHYAKNLTDQEPVSGYAEDMQINDAENISEVEENKEFTFPTLENGQSVADGKEVSTTKIDEKPIISKVKRKLSFVPEHLAEELTFKTDLELQENDGEKAIRKDTGKMPLLEEDTNHQKVGYSQQISIDKTFTFENTERGESSGAYASIDGWRKNDGDTSTLRQYNDRELIQSRVSHIDDYTPPISELELSISASYLTKTHSICVVYVQPSDRTSWIEYQRTDMIANNINPDYKKKITLPFNFGRLRPIKLEIYGFDPDAENLTHTLIGFATFNIAQLLFRGRGLVKLDLSDGSDGGQPSRSFVTISVLELPIEKESAQIRMELDASIGRGFNALTLVGVKPSHFRSFITIYILINETNEFKEVHETETVRTTSATSKSRSYLQWEPISIPYVLLSEGDHDRRLKFVCWRAGATGENETIGEFEISLKQLRRDRSRRFPLIDPESKNKTSDSWINIRYFHVCSFVNYIMGGFKMETLIGIDFSDTNGVKGDPLSLHNVDFSTNQLNSYEETLNSIIPIIEEFSVDKQFSVYGFPGFSQVKDPLRTYEEIFHVNLNPRSSICTGMEGILTAYRNVLQRIDRFNHELNLIPIIEEVTRLARKNPKYYYVVLILTTGDIFYPDYLLGKTMEALKDASSHPVSIIMIGIGDRNSKFFELIETKFQYSEREIVKFVPAEKFISEAGVDRSRFASEALAKIPSQLLSYMLQNNVLPKDPPTDVTYLPSNRTINN